METNEYINNGNSSTEEEESLLMKRLIALQKQLEADDEPISHNTKTLYNTKENVITNTNRISSSKFKYYRFNNHNDNKFLSTKIDNRNFTKSHSKTKSNNLQIKTNNLSSKIYVKSKTLNSTPVKNVTVIDKKNLDIVNNSKITKITDTYNLEINKIVNNSHVKNSEILLNVNSDISQTLCNIDKYIINVQDYLTSSKYVVNKEDMSVSSTNKSNNHAKNVHVNRKFQNQLMSNNLLNSNLKSVSNSSTSINKSINISKRKLTKKLSGKIIESPYLVKIGNTKLIRQSLIRNKWKINNRLNCNGNNTTEWKPLTTLQVPTKNALIPSYNETKWTKVTNPMPSLPQKSIDPNNTNKLKWTKPNILLVNNVNNNKHPLVSKSDKLILFGKNKIIRQSLISSIQSKTKNYLLKHLSHRVALMRKLQQKNNMLKVKNVTTTNEQIQNSLLSKRNKLRKRFYSIYSYVNPVLRLKTDNNSCPEKTECSNINILRLHNFADGKLKQNLKLNNDTKKNCILSNNKTVERFRSKKTLTKQLCLVFNSFGICSKLNQGKCDKRHYKKFITLCTKFLTGKCSNENCTLSHNISEEKIPYCKHYLNSVCVQLNCPYLHEYRDPKTPICKNFLHGYCTLGKKCLKKHLNLCPVFESKKICPHGQKCLYPHIQLEEKNIVDSETNEPRYFEITIPNNEESKENKSIHIVPKRHAPLMDLPSYIPLEN